MNHATAAISVQDIILDNQNHLLELNKFNKKLSDTELKLKQMLVKKSKPENLAQGIVKKEGICCLSDDIMFKIFIFLNEKNIFNIHHTCKRWNSVSNNPLFLKDWTRIYRPNVFRICKDLDSEDWQIYGKTALIQDTTDNRIRRVAAGQNTIFKMNIFTLFASSPIVLPLLFNAVVQPLATNVLEPIVRMTLKPVHYICNSLAKCADAGFKSAALEYMKNNPTVCYESAMEVVIQMNDNMSLLY